MDGFVVYQDFDRIKRDFSVLHSQRVIGGNVNLGTEYACIACRRILDRNRKLISARA